MNRCVIVGGSEIRNYDFVKGYLKQDDFVIYCDSGLYHMDSLEANPSLIVGDFDSHANPHMETETIVLPTVKDDTDTLYAVREALKRGFRDFLLVGVIGKRLDHTLGNLAILLKLDDEGARGVIVDDYSEISVVSAKGKKSSSDGIASKYTFAEKGCKYFSVLSAGGDAHGVTITNAKYNVSGADIVSSFPIGVSNQVAGEEPAAISVEDGRLFLIKIFSE